MCELEINPGKGVHTNAPSWDGSHRDSFGEIPETLSAVESNLWVLSRL